MNAMRNFAHIALLVASLLRTSLACADDIPALVVEAKNSLGVLRPTPPVAPSASNSPEDTQPTSTILMVCEHGNVKSLMAASYFNELAKARHLPFHAIARGTAPDSTTVPAPIVAGMRSDGFDVADFHPAAISTAEVTGARRVVLINTELTGDMANSPVPTERWMDVPPASVNYDSARESLKSHIKRLVEQLEHSSRK